jgi:class 3 adenylate cyclase
MLGTGDPLTRTILRVFVAAPGDVSAEREIARKTMIRMNERGLARLLGYLFEPVEWTSHARPAPGNPQQQILQQVQLETCDVFLGILWTRFGTPTGNVSRETGLEFQSGTEEEFSVAYNGWRTSGKPDIMVFRCARPVDPTAKIVRHLGKVEDFFEQMDPHGANPALHYKFSTVEDFEARLEAALEIYLQQLSKAKANTAPSRLASGYSPAGFHSQMKVGETYAVTFLCVDIVGHSALVTKFPESSRKILDGFRDLVVHSCSAREGEIFGDWMGDGGLILFWKGDHRADAVVSGMDVLQRMVALNLDPRLNPVPEEIQITAAVAEGKMTFSLPVGTISSQVINFVSHLRAQFTAPGQLCVPASIIENLAPKVGKYFSSKGHFEGRKIFTFSSIRLRGKGREALDLAEVIQETSRQITLAIDGVGDHLTSEDIAKLRMSFSALYSGLDDFGGALREFDHNWSPAHVQNILKTTQALAASEEGCWLKLRYLLGKDEFSHEETLDPLVKIVSSKRAYPIATLSRLERVLSRALGIQEQPRTDKVGELIKKFLAADDLDREAIVVEFLVSERKPLCERLSAKTAGSEILELGHLFWPYCDMIAHFDAHDLSAKEFEVKVLECLTHAKALRENGAHFKFALVRRLLKEKGGGNVDALSKDLLAKAQFLQEDIQVVHRSLALAHRDKEIVARATKQLDMGSFWEAVSRPSLPIGTLCALADRAKRSRDAFVMKVLFDCCRPRVEQILTGFEGRNEFAEATRLFLSIMNFEVLVEGEYYYRFVDLFERFQERAKGRGFKVEYLERVRAKLEAQSRSEGATIGAEDQGRLKETLRGLPKVLERRLAGDPLYLMLFISHPDDRIALETLPNIGSGNGARILQIPSLNRTLFQKLVKNPDLIGRSPALQAALNNPLCEVGFAVPHLKRLARSQEGLKAVRKIAQNFNANSAVRASAKSLLPSWRAEQKA